MIDGVIIKKLQKFSDDRGWLVEFIRKDETEYQPAMGYVSETLPGVVRGPHEHLQQTDLFVFLSGKFRLFLWDNRKDAANYRVREVFEVGADNPCSVLVPPGVVHAYHCVSETPGWVVNLPDKLYLGANKKEEVDEVRWEAIPDSPFKLE